MATCPTVKFKINLPTDNNPAKSEVKENKTDSVREEVGEP